MTIDARGLVERLREEKVLSRDAHGNTLSCTRNPDGTEAADLIEAQSATIEQFGQRILMLLGGLRDDMSPRSVRAFQELAALATKGGASEA